MKQRPKIEEKDAKQADELDEQIHAALVEMGWIIPRSEADIRRAEAALKTTGPQSLPARLADPDHLMRRLEEPDSTADAPLKGILAAAKAKGVTSTQLARATNLTVVLLTMFDRGMISTRNLPRVVIDRLAAAIGSTTERLIEYLQAGPRLAADARFKADEVPELEEPQDFSDAVNDDPTITPELRDYLLSLTSGDV
jgi:hypothetical protein